jgi:hypothetical protein
MEVLPQADYDMHDSEFFIVTHTLDGQTWSDDELVEKTPVKRVREILGGRWDRSSSYGSFMKAFFAGPKKRVLVLGFPPGKSREFVESELRRIREGREDRS